MLVKVGIMPGAVTELALNDGAKVSDALSAADLSATGYEIRVSGNVVTPETAVAEGQTVLLVKKIKGNTSIEVKAGIMPGAISTYAVESGTTVAAVLALAGLNATGYEIRISGSVVSPDAIVTTNGTTILLVKKIKGNA